MAEPKTYYIEALFRTADNKEFGLSMDIQLIDLRNPGREWNQSDSWLDNYYRPAILREFKEVIARYTYDGIVENIDEVTRELQLASNGICDTLSMAQ